MVKNDRVYTELKRGLLKKVVEELCLNYLVIYPDLAKLAKKLSNEQLEKVVKEVVTDVKNYSQSS